MKPVLVLATVVVLLALLVSSVLANIIFTPPHPTGVTGGENGASAVENSEESPDRIEMVEIRGSNVVRTSGG